MTGSIWPPDAYEQTTEPEPVPEPRPEFVEQAQKLEKRIYNHREAISNTTQRTELDASFTEQLDIYQAVEALNQNTSNEPERDIHNNIRMAQINAEALIAHRVGELEKGVPQEYISRAYPGLRTAFEKEQQALALLEKIEKIGQSASQWEKNQSANWVEVICQQIAEFYLQYRDITLETLTRDVLIKASVDEYTRSEAARLMINHPNLHVQAVGVALLDRLTTRPFPIITQSLLHSTPTVRESGVKCFSREGVIQKLLLNCAADPDTGVRDAISDVLSQTASLLPKYLAIALGDEDPFIRRSALELVMPPDFCAAENKKEWEKIRNHLLILAELDPNLDMREKATKLLGWFPFEDATKLLKHLTSDRHGQPEIIRKAAAQSLAMQHLLEDKA